MLPFYCYKSRKCFLAAFILIVLVVQVKGQAKNKKPVVIGYVGGYRGIINSYPIAAQKLTHINYAFINVKNNHAVINNPRVDTANLKNLVELKKINPAINILISIGGWSWSKNFSDAVLTDTSRKAFAASAVDIARKYGLDGVDIDWEYPGMQGNAGNIVRAEDKENYTLMFKELRSELDILQAETGKKKLLTTAVGAFTSFLSHTEMAKAQQYLDLVNLMTYDYSPSVTGHHTNLYASKKYNTYDYADKAVLAFTAAGVPASKLVMGVAFYGRMFQLGETAKEGIGQPNAKQVGYKGYSLIKDSLLNRNGFAYYRDEDAKAPYLYNDSIKQFLTYEDEWSVKTKCSYVLKKKMAGVMFWEYDSDMKEYLLDEIVKCFR